MWLCRRLRRGGDQLNGGASLAGDDPDGGKLHRFTLRFRHPQTELEYRREALKGLRTSLFSFSLIVCCVSVIILLLLQLWEWMDGTVWEDYHPNAASDQVTVFFFIIVFMLFNVVVSRFHCVFQRVAPVYIELYFVLVALVLFAAIVLIMPHYMGTVKGYPEPETPPKASADTNLLLTLSGLTLAMHLNPHIRWHMMIPVQVFCVLGYALPALLLRGPDPIAGVLIYTCELAGLVAAASQGKRMTQIQERRNFLHLLNEKTRRFESEFQLSQKSSHHCPYPDDFVRCSKSKESLPTTTFTGRHFSIDSEGDGWQLEGVQHVGQMEQWLVDSKDLSWTKDMIVGVGGFGIVVKGQYQGMTVAVKVPKAATPSQRSFGPLGELCNELQILRRVRHPNIVVFFGAWLDEQHNDLALVLEYVDGVPLSSFIGEGPNDVDRADVLVQISSAIRYLHTLHPRVVHGDLKDNNIHVVSCCSGHGKIAKLLDFGLARKVTKRARQSGGSARWMAPEILQGGNIPGTASDVFSLGCIVFFVATGRVPGQGKNRALVLLDLRRGITPSLVWPPEKISSEYLPLVSDCNQVDPTARPSMCTVHDRLTNIWESHGGKPAGRHDHMESDMYKELCSLRRAANIWRPKAPRLLGQRTLTDFDAPQQQKVSL